jgi:hypothetical protein
MTYGNYKYIAPYPKSYKDRFAWIEHTNRLKEMSNWVSEQKWDHWGSEKTPDGFGFWFSIEENYIAFKEHFGVEE